MGNKSACAHCRLCSYVCKTLAAQKKKTQKKPYCVFSAALELRECIVRDVIAANHQMLNFTNSCVSEIYCVSTSVLRGHYKWDPVFTRRACVCVLFYFVGKSLLPLSLPDYIIVFVIYK